MTAKYPHMTTDLRELTEIGRRRQARRFVLVAALTTLGVLIMAMVVVDPTTTVGAIVLAVALASALVGLLLGYWWVQRGSGAELPFSGLPRAQRKDVMMRLLKGGEITDDELQVADGLLTSARGLRLPLLFGFTTAMQIPYAFGDQLGRC